MYQENISHKLRIKMYKSVEIAKYYKLYAENRKYFSGQKVGHSGIQKVGVGFLNAIRFSFLIQM